MHPLALLPLLLILLAGDRARRRGRADPRQAIRQAGFADEAQAAAWAATVVGHPRPSELEQMRRVGATRPELGLATVRYIVRQLAVRGA